MSEVPRPKLAKAQHSARGTAGGVEPDGLSGWSERGVREGEAESFGDDLGGGGGSHELAASAGRGAGAAADFRGVFEGDLLLCESCTDGLGFGCVFSALGQQGDAAGDEDGGQITCGGEGHHHRRQSLVAGGDSQHAGARGQRAHEAAEDDGCVVAEGERIHHAQRALGAAIARVGAGSGEGYGVQIFQLAGGFGDEQADFPVAGVKSQSNGAAVFGAKAAVGAEDEDFGPGETRRVPAHAGVLAQSEKIA